MNHSKSFTTRARALIAGSVIAAALLVPLGVATSPASATSPFCTALFSWVKHPAPAPTGLTLKAYHAWANKLLPYYEKMQATAPNAATKTVLTDVVVVLKAYGNYTSLTKLSLYEKAHHAAFEVDVKELAKALTACYTGAVIKLP